MKRKVDVYISRCLECQKVKAKHRHTTRLLQPIHIIEWKREIISIDFITKLPWTMRRHDFIMEVVDKLTKAAQFIIVKSTYKEICFSKIYMKEISVLQNMPKKNILDRDPQPKS